VRPGREDIAIPPFPPGIAWIGADDPASERLTARAALLVHFFELGELSSIRTLPFVTALARAYAEDGLAVLGVHSPRSPLAAGDDALAAGIARLDLDFPVANDREHRIWNAYGCQGWPSTFLWGRGGTLRWVHFGEGAYGETERAVRAELAEIAAEELPEPLFEAAPQGRPPRIGKPSAEVFPGGSHEVPWEPGEPGEPLEVEYAGAGAWAALDGEGTVAVAVDGEPTGTIDLDGPGLYELSGHPEHGIHEVRLELDGEVRVWSLAFAPGPAR
jgi:hypothetical protein